MSKKFSTDIDFDDVDDDDLLLPMDAPVVRKGLSNDIDDLDAQLFGFKTPSLSPAVQKQPALTLSQQPEPRTPQDPPPSTSKQGSLTSLEVKHSDVPASVPQLELAQPMFQSEFKPKFGRRSTANFSDLAVTADTTISDKQAGAETLGKQAAAGDKPAEKEDALLDFVPSFLQTEGRRGRRVPPRLQEQPTLPLLSLPSGFSAEVDGGSVKLDESRKMEAVKPDVQVKEEPRLLVLQPPMVDVEKGGEVAVVDIKELVEVHETTGQVEMHETTGHAVQTVADEVVIDMEPEQNPTEPEAPRDAPATVDAGALNSVVQELKQWMTEQLEIVKQQMNTQPQVDIASILQDFAQTHKCDLQEAETRQSQSLHNSMQQGFTLIEERITQQQYHMDSLFEGLGAQRQFLETESRQLSDALQRQVESLQMERDRQEQHFQELLATLKQSEMSLIAERQKLDTDQQEWMRSKQKDLLDLEQAMKQLSDQETRLRKHQEEYEIAQRKERERMDTEKIAMENEVEELTLLRAKLEQETLVSKSELERLRHDHLRYQSELQTYESLKQTLHRQEMEIRRIHEQTAMARQGSDQAQRKAEEQLSQAQALKSQVDQEKSDVAAERRKVHAERLELAKELQRVAQSKADAAATQQTLLADFQFHQPIHSLVDEWIQQENVKPRLPNKTMTPLNRLNTEKNMDSLGHRLNLRRLEHDVLDTEMDLAVQKSYLQKAQLKLLK